MRRTRIAAPLPAPARRPPAASGLPAQQHPAKQRADEAGHEDPHACTRSPRRALRSRCSGTSRRGAESARDEAAGEARQESGASAPARASPIACRDRRAGRVQGSARGRRPRSRQGPARHGIRRRAGELQRRRAAAMISKTASPASAGPRAAEPGRPSRSTAQKTGGGAQERVEELHPERRRLGCGREVGAQARARRASRSPRPRRRRRCRSPAGAARRRARPA